MRLALGAEHFAAEYGSEIRALLLLGTAARVAFYAGNQGLGFGIEPAEIARSLAAGRGFALSGVPSAHSAPLFPFIMAGFLKLFGDGPAFSYSMIGLQIVFEWALSLYFRSLQSGWSIHFSSVTSQRLCLSFPMLCRSLGKVPQACLCWSWQPLRPPVPCSAELLSG